MTLIERYMQHGRDWDGENPAGWFVTEKLNGCRCFWDGANAWSKSGERIPLPARIHRELPGTSLDGEIYAGRGGFESARAAVQYNQWVKDVQFVAFDKPDAPGNLMERLRSAQSVWPHCVTTKVCQSYAELMDDLRAVQADGGEGLMIHAPQQINYTPGRTGLIRKVKLVLPLLD